jgi:translation initiation factor RLI1
MNNKVALVDYNKCSPEKCKNGICTAAEVCKQRLLIQEKPFDIPMASPFLCRSCGDCARACPLKAIQIMPL